MNRRNYLIAMIPCVLTACSAAEPPPEPGGSAETAAAASMASTSSAASRTTGDTRTGSASGSQAQVASTKTDTCGVEQVKGWLSAEPTADIKAQIAKAAGDRPIRYYTQGDPITMDYSEARLNVVLGRSGRINEFRCG